MTDAIIALAIDAAERALVPDAAIRAGIRRLCRERLRQIDGADAAVARARHAALVAAMSRGPIAPVPEKANAQHYEAPVPLFEQALGPHLKYSSGYWPAGVTSLADAEAAALAQTCAHADLADGQEVLELGCGWGSLTLWMAARYPASRITAVSNSRDQRVYILARAAERGLGNVEVITADMNTFDLDRRVDRIVSVEMFEHMRNYAELLRRVSGWMRDDARLFLHIFCHRAHAYAYDTDGAANWMGRHFFSGGLMPSATLLRDFQQHVHVTDEWHWDGTHYERTANAWLANLDAARDVLGPVFERHYGTRDAARWFQRWRIFFMACAELWGYDAGREWHVMHYRLAPGPAAAAGRTRDAA